MPRQRIHKEGEVDFPSWCGVTDHRDGATTDLAKTCQNKVTQHPYHHVPSIILSSPYITSYRISPYLMSCQTVSHHIVSCPIVAHAILPSPFIPHHIIPFHLMSYLIDTCITPPTIKIFQCPLGQAAKSNAGGWIRRALQRHGEILWMPIRWCLLFVAVVVAHNFGTLLLGIMAIFNIAWWAPLNH